MSLLDKASLVQIPSGYKATKLYSVVPDSGAGDFTFARSSSGTRVNSEGLIETAEILTDELAINGDFDTDSDWTKGSGWSIVNGEAVHTGSGDYIEQGSLTQGKNYRVVIVVTQASGSGFPQIYMGGLTTAMTSPNTYTFDITAQSGDKIKLRGLNDCKVDSISVKELFQNDVPRLDYSGGATCPTLLLEGQRTNLQTYSEDLTNGAWITSNSSVVPNQTTSPDGTTTADKVDYGAGSGFIRNAVTLGSATTFSIFIKYFDFQWIQIMTSGDVNHYANFDVQNGVLGNVGSSTEAEIEDYGNGWYRIVAKFVSGTFAGQPRLYKISSGVRPWAGGDGDAGSYYMWGGQQEVGAFQTSYIPTTSSTVTRNADVCDNAGTSATFNDAEGVLFAEIAALANDGSNRSISISNGTTSNQIVIRYSSTANQVTAYITDGGVITAQLNYTLSDALSYNKIALKYKVNDVALWVNGTEVATDTSATMPSGFDELKFSRGDGINDFYGKCKQLIYFNEALEDAELTALTTI
jgi:hypothetical protein